MALMRLHRLVTVILILAAPCALARTAPQADQTTASLEFVSGTWSMMTTTVEIKVVVPPGKQPQAEAALLRARGAMQDYADAVNIWEPASGAAWLNAQAGTGPLRVDPRLLATLVKARALSEASGGAFDVTFFPLARIWNVRGGPFKVPSDEEIAEARALVGYQDLILDEKSGTAWLRRKGMELELGALAKGAAVDAAVRCLRQDGFPDALVRASGDMFCAGSKGGAPWMIGVQNPRAPRGTLLGRVGLSGKAISTSGDYEKMKIVGGKRYHHILDPRTGRPAEGAISVTVIGPEAETADALATAILVLGPREGIDFCRKWPGYETLIVDPEMKITKTGGFPELMEVGE